MMYTICLSLSLEGFQAISILVYFVYVFLVWFGLVYGV